MKNAFLRKATFGLFLLTISSSQAASTANRLIVKFKSASTLDFGQSLDQRIESLKTSGSASELGSISTQTRLSGNLALIRYSTALKASEAAHQLATDPNVEWAQPNYIMHTFVQKVAQEVQAGLSFPTLLSQPPTNPTNPVIAPDYVDAPPLPALAIADPRLGEDYGMAIIHAPEAWQLQTGSRKTIVADIDTGIDYTHEDLVNNLWTNPDATAPDVHGYDFANHQAKVFDDEGHGTHTAGTIGATGGNGKGTSGVSQAVSIMAVKFLSAQGSGTTADAVLAIDYAIAHGARVMNNSWGGPATPGDENTALEEAVQRAGDANILFVAAAGNEMSDNDKSPTYPAAIKKDNVLTVAATDSTDSIAKYSNYGLTTVHVGAPGSGILSTLPGNNYGKEDGTSMACPHVVGLAALIISEKPSLTALQVKQIIIDSVDVIPALQGKTVSGGRINARAALERARNFGVE